MPAAVKKKSLDRLDQSCVDLGLDRMFQLMERLGNPERGFRSVHIAGTNGKGSTAAFVASILGEGGCRTGLYTSPHLERFSERIRTGAVEISGADIDDISSAVRKAAEETPAIEATYFELTTAVAFLYFARQKVDIAVIETGLGGRLDATNVLSPLVSVITPVEIDHVEYLGYTLEGVAAEKGGIIKEGTPVVIGRQEDSVVSVLEKMAAKKGADAALFGRDFRIADSGADNFSYSGINLALGNLEISLIGRHQRENAAVAVAVIEHLNGMGLTANEEEIRKGLKNTIWPGRFEVLSSEPEIIIDGAHNPAGARMLAAALGERFEGERGVFVAGFMSDKDVSGIVEALAPLAEAFIFTRPATERAFDPEEEIRYKGVLEKSCEVMVIPDVGSALREGMRRSAGQKYMVVTGSLYLIGEARRVLKGLL